MIDILLQQLGFSEKEIQIYLLILEKGQILPAELAKLSKINRTTVYSIAKELIKKGVVSEDLGGKNRQLIALPPSDLNNLIKKEEKELSLKQAKVNSAIAELQKVAASTKYSVPKIVFIEEADLENYLYKRTPEWNNSILAKDKIWWGFQDHTFVEAYQEWIDWFWTHTPVGLSLQLLSNSSEVEESMKTKKYDLRKIKFWKSSQEFTSTIWINGDYLVMIVTRNKPYYLVEIHDAILAENLRAVFSGIWQ